MKRGTRTTALILAGVAFLGTAWGLATVVSMSHMPDPPLYTIFCGDIDSTSAPPTWNMVIYLDIDACLACTEDMEAWKELERRLIECGGA